MPKQTFQHKKCVCVHVLVCNIIGILCVVCKNICTNTVTYIMFCDTYIAPYMTDMFLKINIINIVCNENILFIRIS